MSNRIEKVAVVGAGGQVGKFITGELLKTGKHRVTAITRANSTTKLPNGVIIATVDYDDEQSLIRALQGQQFLVITLAVTAPGDTQSKLIRAAAKAGVPHVMPNWFGVDFSNKAMLADLPVPPDLTGATGLVEELGVSSWILLTCGFWYEYSLVNGLDTYGIDIKNRKMEQIDDGQTLISTTTWPQVGKAVAALLRLPVKPEDGQDNSTTLTQFYNSVVYVSSFRVSQKDMFESVKRVTGTSDEDWITVHQKSIDRWGDGLARMQRGDLSGFLKQLYGGVLVSEDNSDFEGNRGVSNELLGLPKEDIDTYTRIAVGRVESGTYEHPM
ncbi:putative oxidoreductase CipA [Dactylonectria estremocensis]|uniref:Oxidoreductase CipA n=1 Tax=Dactylonectria estremocensis TaxID=1079267 RepID=A0A9P9F243_9HYPO|nr:putative oxidoreductase CipA [Dactylonectria estremocensis]